MWQAILQGNAEDQQKCLDDFLQKHGRSLHKQDEVPAPDITTDRVYQAFKAAGNSSASMDGWHPAELALVSFEIARWIAELFELIEDGADWPQAVTHAKIAYLEIEGSKPGEAMSYRPITISAPIYRV